MILLQLKRTRGRSGVFRRAVIAAVAAAAMLGSLHARAALFDDEEARRQIESLKGQVEIGQRALDARLEKLESAVQDRRALLELSSLIDGLRQEIAKLRGQVEVVANQAETVERRQRDLYVDLDTRFRKLEQSQLKLEQGLAQIQERLDEPAREAAREKETYEAGLNQFKLGNYGASIAAFQGFMTAHPSSQLLPSAQYWIGNSYYALRDFKTAITTQRKLLQSWPDNAKAPDAMLNIASSQLESGDAKAARETLQQLVKRYPGSPAADQAKQRLAKR